MKKILFRAIVLSVALFGLSGCGGGGGGGGDDFVGAALVAISAQPTQIDSGGRTRVTCEIQEVHQNGIALKFRFPQGISYVRETAFLEVNGQQIDISPNYYLSSGSSRYLVFFLSRDIFGEDNYGKVTFELRGDSEVKDGRIEVDADVDDPFIANSAEFDVNNPEFGYEDQVKIEVTN